jgi:hypothetical protein
MPVDYEFGEMWKWSWNIKILSYCSCIPPGRTEENRETGESR